MITSAEVSIRRLFGFLCRILGRAGAWRVQ